MRRRMAGGGSLVKSTHRACKGPLLSPQHSGSQPTATRSRATEGESDDLSSTLHLTWWKERTDSLKGSSDPHACTVACGHPSK